ncbi:MAG: DUF4352 domain-containing protein [Candidatus Mcinerneyibacterium aminivorans]|jgi:hypothetical protein|uniref:DUF4352 domain-containing protein n=1 Tax=Candidatus Mcinerneyibacterium aminivorans TaxID=2703815 RepID=A0A5D0MFK5_9BACT|nr:MAG: DUF4352 domain-containing protein [Candidatus Mcinerneyibacterium aminivorans]
MKKLFLVLTILFLILFIMVGCAQKDLRLIKDFYPSTIDTPKEVNVVPSFPNSMEKGAVENVLSIKLDIKNNSRETITIDPSKIYLMVGTEMHATLPAQSVLSSAGVSEHSLKKETLRPGDSTEGIIYFPKTSVSKIKEENVFNLNVDLKEGKKIVVVFQK